jgi:predicted RND superfamily exporter protein
MFRYLSEKNIDNMLYGYGSALAIIAIVMILAIKSVKFGLISLIPNILPTVFAFGLWGIFVGEVGLAVAFVTSFSSGIVVDDSVHFFVKYLRARRTLRYSPAQSIIYTFKTVGSSMLVSTLILAVGFSVLIFSPFQSNASMGILCSLTIFIALISDFFLTPALLMAFDKGTDHLVEHNDTPATQELAANLV